MTNRLTKIGLSRKLLLGAAVGTLSISGCASVPQTPPPSGQEAFSPDAAAPTNGRSVEGASERALYDQALADLSADSVTRFLSEFPASSLTPGLLSRVSGFELGRIPSGVIDALDEDVKAALPLRVKRALGLAPTPAVDRDSDGY